ncbi:RNA polymerase sigma factor [Oharaeibacter diazotrophicus]|uniref:RNA polymerase ECF family sigma subunit n=2 Tax=Oharaeibacter diazotrophicus TaxID=1920512 RepID=A0A4R6RFV8_9HYPH|nr:RNA polymerase sigma factor [Oharaeibacter diazotrophicus]TDP85084.1 RNA polymerase ECF family sigma subunit [Oharaeibacter diazotrophicus]BBE74054.1 RNA polymerase sigma factor [Pleomorphomonas sp. SM30]GLS76257.1 hypothetical protein GCM10007904_15920 [Oharaeibacter diazotrophicus]
MTDPAFVDTALIGARPQVMAALLRWFRDLDTAEEAYQEACLRALSSWPRNGPPRDPAAWLIFVGRNAGVDRVRRVARETALPDDDALVSEVGDAETALADRIDADAYRDDVLRLMFVCCHPALPATQQIALALRVVAGLTVPEIARAFLVGESAMEQRITRAKARIAGADVPFETPGAVERAERLAAVAAMLYLTFNEGYSAGPAETSVRAPLADEAIRLTRLLLRLFPAEPEIMGLLALMLLTSARAPARFSPDGAAIPLDAQDRSLWSRRLIEEGVALAEKGLRHRRPGPYLIQAAIAGVHARAATAAATDWREIEALYAILERLEPSPVVTLNRAVAVARVDGPGAALAMVDPLAGRLDGYFYFHGARGRFLADLGRPGEARAAFGRAIGLARTAAEAAHIRAELDRLGDGAAPH